MRRSSALLILSLFMTWLRPARIEAAEKAGTGGPGVTIEYIGHTCFLITDQAGIRVLTDPYLNGRGQPFPESLSVDLVAISAPEAGHDASYQLRGNPLILGPDRSSGSIGEFQVDGFPLPAKDRRGDNARRGFIIRHGALRIAFLGEIDQALPEETRRLIESSDAVLVGLEPNDPAPPSLASWRGLRTLVPVFPGTSTGADNRQPSSRVLPVTLADWKQRDAPALRVVPNMPREIVFLHPRAESAESTRTTYSVFAGTLVDMTWPQVKEAAAEGALVLVPVGVIEEHGPHMGLGADTYLVYTHARHLKDSLGARGVKAVVAPPYYWGITDDTDRFPGSFTLRPETMAAVVLDICRSLQSWGFRQLVFVNDHGNGNHRRTLAEALSNVRRDLGIQAIALDSILSSAPLYRPLERPGRFTPDFHAGAYETRMMADEFPADVDLRIVGRLLPQREFSPLGYAGDPASYLKENGYSDYYTKAAEYDAPRIIAHLAPAGSVPAGEGKPPDAVDRKAQTAIDRFIRALGGKDRLEAVRTQSRMGELHEGDRKTALRATAAAGGKWSLILQASGSVIERFGYDGSVGWMAERGETRQLPEDRATTLSAVLDPRMALRLTRLFPKLGMSQEQGPGDEEAVLLEGEMVSGAKLTLAFDTKSGLLQRMGDVRFADYRDVGGVMIPFSVSLEDGHALVKFSRIENNIPVDESDFNPQ